MVFFEVYTRDEIGEQFANFERRLEDLNLKIVTAYNDQSKGILFIVVGTLIKAEDDFTIELARSCFDGTSISLSYRVPTIGAPPASQSVSEFLKTNNL